MRTSPAICLSLFLANTVFAGNDVHPGPGARNFDHITIDPAVNKARADNACGKGYSLKPVATVALPDGAPHGVLITSDARFWIQIGKTFVCHDKPRQKIDQALAAGDLQLYAPIVGTTPFDVAFSIEVPGDHPWPDSLQPIEIADQIASPLIGGGDVSSSEWAPLAVVHLPYVVKGLMIGDHKANAETRWRGPYTLDGGPSQVADTDDPFGAPGYYVLEARRLRPEAPGFASFGIQQSNVTKFDPYERLMQPPFDLPAELRVANLYIPELDVMRLSQVSADDRSALFLHVNGQLEVRMTRDVEHGPRKGEPVVIFADPSGWGVLTMMGTIYDSHLFHRGDWAVDAPVDYQVSNVPDPDTSGPVTDTTTIMPIAVSTPDNAPWGYRHHRRDDRYNACVAKVLKHYDDTTGDYDLFRFDDTGDVTVETLADRKRADADRICTAKRPTAPATP